MPEKNQNSYFEEQCRSIPVVEQADVVVCGSGPAGIAAALSAARSGAKTTLIEVHGCLGGVWTAGMLSWVIDSHDKPGIMKEIIARLDQRGARTLRVEDGRSFGYDIEQMKLLLEEMMLEAGVRVLIHTRIVAVGCDQRDHVDVVITESKSGRQAIKGACFIDATGDGDLAAFAGCSYDLGRPEDGGCQPMSLMAVVSGVRKDEIKPFIGGGLREPKARLLAEFKRAGVAPSYSAPTLFKIHDELYGMMANHQYDVSAVNSEQISAATLTARAEIHRLVAALRSLGPPWDQLYIVGTAEQIGVREGRRIHGEYVVRMQDLIEGVRHEDAICRVCFGIDVHSTDDKVSQDFASENKTKTLPYDIPYRALIAKGFGNLLLSGRCISGDFFAHASYRVTGNAVTMGQGAGVAAALIAKNSQRALEVSWADIEKGMDAINKKVSETYLNSEPDQLVYV
ncbi:FAD-dependent oxidoreductase [Coraliomargarita sp. SDUM461004]|uniref:FAD-dependent oxidoreductase n=1 Tax=Thalassobacterium sedimentorum TaxID=3041258 RepID=A0ABU1ADY8_9BACT|nr:FAD-dependent oxidoreductase [Coraliomargarita sp. SDUM461004]MDQ8192802.1 FAD-dependent oxidoreductase [Coraliomargarita sp. SDUM461004]